MDEAVTCDKCPFGKIAVAGSKECSPPATDPDAKRRPSAAPKYVLDAGWYPRIRHNPSNLFANRGIAPMCDATNGELTNVSSSSSSLSSATNETTTDAAASAWIEMSFLVDLETRDLEVTYAADRTFAQSCTIVVPIFDDARPDFVGGYASFLVLLL